VDIAPLSDGQARGTRMLTWARASKQMSMEVLGLGALSR
jgi:hypothetical protein